MGGELRCPGPVSVTKELEPRLFPGLLIENIGCIQDHPGAHESGDADWIETQVLVVTDNKYGNISVSKRIVEQNNSRVEIDHMRIGHGYGESMIGQARRKPGGR